MENMEKQCWERGKSHLFKMDYDPTKPYIEKILSLISSDWNEFPPPASVDGIGTKGVYHWKRRSFRNATLDALAMNLNDMAVLRAKTAYLQDHIMIPKDDERAILEIIKTLAEECKKRKITINAGETSIHNNLSGLEISISVQGDYIQKKKNKFMEKNCLIGIESNGLHSNGFTKIREIFGEEFLPEFIKPTLIYYDMLLGLNDKIEGMVNITGGAYSRIKRVLNKEDVLINRSSFLKPSKIFYEIYNRGMSEEEMYKTFNCGIGFILNVYKKDSGFVLSEINKSGFKSDIIGEIAAGNGNIRIESSFSNKEIIL